MKMMNSPAGRFLLLLLIPALLCPVFLVPAPAGADGATPGIISTVAGKAGVSGYTGDGGPASSATLYKPVGVAADTHGDLYIADSDNGCIREISASNHTQYGIKMISKDIYTVASSIDRPGGLALDSSGNLYIADNNIESLDQSQTSAVYELTAGGNFGTVAGAGHPGYSGDGGPALKAEVNFPQSVAVDVYGNIYIADSFNQCVREVAATTHTQYGISMTAGDIYTVTGTGVYGYNGDGILATGAKLWYPTGVAVDGSGNLYIAEQGGSRIREVPATDHTQYGIDMTANDIYTVAGGAVAGHGGDGGPATSAGLYGPYSITCDSSGDLYICFAGGDDPRIREVDASGVINTVAGNGTSGYTGDGGPATSAELAAPEGVAVEGSGAFFISDWGMDTIRKVSYAPTKSSLGVSSPNVLLNGTVLVYATVFDSYGNLDTSGGANVSVTVTGIPDPVVLKDDGTGGDFSANDGVYSADVQIPGPGTAAIDLTVNGVAMGSTSVNVITDPALLVLTDLGALYNEFENTGMTPADDLNGNGIPDYYDLLTRLNQYAGVHNGIVIDLPREITKSNGYAYDYSSLVYGYNTREMGSLIDNLVYNMSQISKFRDVAIIGDDSVVPFYRMADPDPDMVESEYPTLPEDLGTDYGNPTLEDTALNYIMTDVPYASFNNVPDSVTRPQLDAGIGRIFADSPYRLAQIIDGYETPVKLEAATRTANLFNLLPDTVNWPNAVKLALTPILGRNFTKVPGPAAVPGDYAQLNGVNTPWKPGDVAWSATNDDLTLIWSHATHMYQNTEKNPDIVAGTYDSIPEAEPGHVVISTGCHSGYSVGHVSSIGDYTPYDQSLVKSLINKEVTYIAPTTYGIGDEQHGVAYHDLILSCFLDNLLNKNTATVGDAQVAAYRQYWATCKPQYLNVTSTYATFGTELYGLPTQPDDPPAVNALPVQDSPEVVPAQHPKAPGDPSLDFAVDIPNFEVTTDSQGNDLFQVPGDSAFMINAFAPYLPLVEKSFLLPAGSTVNSVTLDSVVSSVYQGQVNLQTEIPVNENTGPVQGSFTIPNPYPDSRYWYSAYPGEGGVMLTVSVVPMQYDPDTKQVTLYNHLDFNVDYSSPAATASISSVQANNGNPLQTGTSSVPCSTTVSSSSSTSATLLWEIRDNSGGLLSSGNEDLHLSAGSSTYDFNTGTLGWSPGPADLTVALSVGGSIVDSQTVPLMVDGISLQDSLSPDTYDTTATTGSLTTDVMDEQGAPVAGLTSGSFSLAIDGTSVAAAVYSGGSSGTYSLGFPITGLPPGGHDLTIACTDSRGLSAGDDLSFTITQAVSGPTFGNIYTVAGNGTFGSSINVNGTPATSAELSIANGGLRERVTVDSAGNIYIVDPAYDVVYEVAATDHTQFGIPMTAHDIYLVAGNGTASYPGEGVPATGGAFTGLGNPQGVAVDASGNLYIADMAYSCIQEVAATDHTQFGISMTDGDIYTVAGMPTLYGSLVDGVPALATELDYPIGVTVDASGNLYMIDHGRIREVAATDHTQFGINMTANYIYSVAGGGLYTSYGEYGDNGRATSAYLNNTQGVAVDSAGNLYIADSTECREVAATNHTQFGIPMTANYIYAVAGADGPSAVAVDSSGNLYFAETGTSTIREVDTGGAIATVAGTGTYGYNGDGIPATSADLSLPSDMALDSAGNIYIADEGNKRIREVLVVGGQTAAAPLAITTAYLPPGTEGTAYSTTLAATGGTSPYTWQASGLPGGLNINTVTGEVYGTPTASGDFSVTATVYDSSSPEESASANFDLSIEQPLFAINATSLPSGTVGMPYTTGSSTLVASGGAPPYAWSSIGLPGGLNINTVTGVIYGTPTISGDYSVYLSVYDSSSPERTSGVDRGLTIYPAAIPPVQPPQPPGFSIPSGIYDKGTDLAITNPNEDAVSEAVYYTMDYALKGISPTVSGAVYYSGQISLQRSATVEAAVYDHTAGWSIPAIATYDIRPDTPVISPPSGTYTAAQSVTITGIDEGDTACYTTDGSDPSTNSSRIAYQGAFTVSQTETVTAEVYDPLTGVYSHPATAEFTISIPMPVSGGGGPAVFAPTVQTDAATSITAASAALNGDITSNDNSSITGYGFLWGTSSSSLTNTLEAGTSDHTGSFTATLGGLTAGTTYYFQAYATNEMGTGKGAVMSFTATATMPPMPALPLVFSDVPPSYWAHDVIYNLAGPGYISGYPDGTFKPAGQITRAEVAAIMDKLLNLAPYTPPSPTFTDVSPDDWFYQVVETAVHAGIAKGYSDGTFHPDAPISRQEIACVMVQALGKSQLADSNAQAVTKFLDDQSIAWWSRGYIFVALQQEIVHGYPDNTFEPNNETTRAEACAMIVNFLIMHD